MDCIYRLRTRRRPLPGQSSTLDFYASKLVLLCSTCSSETNTHASHFTGKRFFPSSAIFSPGKIFRRNFILVLMSFVELLVFTHALSSMPNKKFSWILWSHKHYVTVQESASEYREASKKVNECATICIYYIMETMDIPMHQLCILNITNMHF